MQNTHRVTNKDRNKIRRHMFDYVDDETVGWVRGKGLDNDYKKKLGKKRLSKNELKLIGLEQNGKNATDYESRKYGRNKYREGMRLVEGGSFLIYNDEIENFVAKIYGKKKAREFTERGIIFDVYCHLITREYSDMLNDFGKGNPLLKNDSRTKKKSKNKTPKKRKTK